MTHYCLDNINDRKVTTTLDELSLICDPNAETKIITFSRTQNNRGSWTLEVVQSVTGLPWMTAKLRLLNPDSNTSPTELKDTVPVTDADNVELILVCARDSKKEERASALEKKTNVSIEIIATSPNKSQHQFSVEIRQIRFQTRLWKQPIIKFEYPEIPPMGRLAMISREGSGASSSIVLCEVSVISCYENLTYSGDRVSLNLTAAIAALAENGTALKPAISYEDTESSISHDSEPKAASFSDYVRTEKNQTYKVSVSVDELIRLPNNNDIIDIYITLDLDIENSNRENSKKQISIQVNPGEEIAIEINGDISFPKISHPTEEPSIKNSEISIFIPNPREHYHLIQCNSLDFKVYILDTSISQVKLYGAIEPLDRDVTIDWTEIKNWDIYNKNCVNEVNLPLDSLVRMYTPEECIPDLHLFLRFQVGEGNQIKEGILSFPIDISEPKPSNLVCVDFGASAIAAWFGPFRRDSDTTLIPLGSFVFRIAGSHAEYDPNADRNDFAPSSIDLDPLNHLRSRHDPMSLGCSERVGTSDDAVTHRLQAFRRRYDVSLPAFPSAPTDDQQSGFPDLKRRFLTSSARLAKSVPSLAENGLVLADTVNLEHVMEDAFRELGAYIIPNAMYADSKSERNRTREISPFERWEASEPSEIQVAIAHPSGISKRQRNAYYNASLAFSEEFAGMGNSAAKKRIRQPKLIPEALAAAYFGITRHHSAPDRSSNVFACIDIGASTVDASLIRAHRITPGAIENWQVLAHFGATVGGTNLDEALLATSLRALECFFPGLEGDFRDLEIHQKQQIKSQLSREIQNAKRTLSNALRKIDNGNRGYDWSLSAPKGRFSISLKGIVRGRLAGKALQTNDHEKEFDKYHKVTLSVRSTQGAGQSIFLEIPSTLLDGSNKIPDLNPDDPRLVARFLGRAIPAMLIREANRLSLPAPEWVVTGRASLWPSIYSGITQTAKLMNTSPLPREKPFSPDDMKQAIVLGVRSLAEKSLPLSDNTMPPYAVIVYNEANQQIESVEYLDTQSSGQGQGIFEYRANGQVSRLAPGLGDAGDEKTITREEILQLFRAFGQRATDDVGGIRPTKTTDPRAEKITVSWSLQNESMVFRIGNDIYTDFPHRMHGV